MMAVVSILVRLHNPFSKRASIEATHRQKNQIRPISFTREIDRLYISRGDSHFSEVECPHPSFPSPKLESSL